MAVAYILKFIWNTNPSVIRLSESLGQFWSQYRPTILNEIIEIGYYYYYYYYLITSKYF